MYIGAIAFVKSHGVVHQWDHGWVNPDDLQMRILNKTSDDLELDNYDLDKVEKTIIIKVMKMHQGNISKAASELGLTRTSLYRRMEKYGL